MAVIVAVMAAILTAVSLIVETGLPGGGHQIQLYIMRRSQRTNKRSPPRPAPHNYSSKRIIMESQSEVASKLQRRWTFNLTAPTLSDCERPALIGDCPELGSWKPAAVRPLTLLPDGIWTTDLLIPDSTDISYRYCIAVFSDITKPLIRSWEGAGTPRTILKSSTPPTTPDVYGKYDKIDNIQRGWLTSEKLLQLKFHNNPFTFHSNKTEGNLKIKITPIPFHLNYNDVIKSSNEDALKCSVTQVATIDPTNCKFVNQEEFGRAYKTNDFLIFNVLSANLCDLALSVDFYKDGFDSSPEHLASSYLLPNTMKNSEGQIEPPIISNSTRRPIGSMRVEYLVVKPMPENPCDMRVSYMSLWRENWNGLDVGHRGSGSSFTTKEIPPFRENTIASLKNAISNGADMVEFDVQLSKDLVPVVYHDFHVCIASKRKSQTEYSDMLEIPLMDLSLEELQKLKIYHVEEGKNKEPRYFDEDLVEHQPFPTLAEVFKAIDPYAGFNIEIKGIMPYTDGSLDLEHPFDMNLYLDKILEVVLKCGGQRRIVFSSFQPDICTMLRIKQNLYPTMFLTQGVTKKYQSYRDLRCNSIPAAVNHALNAELLGIVVHTEDLLRDPTQVKLVIDAGLIIFCWGEDNNNINTIEYLKKLGLHGVIYDRMDQYCTKKIKEGIFLMEAREAEAN